MKNNEHRYTLLSRIKDLSGSVARGQWTHRSLAEAGIEPHKRINVKIGGDFETRARHPERGTLGTYGDGDLTEAFCERIYEKIGEDQFTCRPEKEKYRIELNPIPDSPLRFIRRWHHFNNCAKEVAQDMGMTFDMRQGHFHLSCWQDDKPLFNGEYEKHSAFSLAVAAELLHMQIAHPALCVSPIKAEQTNPLITVFGSSENLSKDGSLYLQMGKYYRYEDGSQKFEVRINNGSPYLPVLLILEAIQTVLAAGIDLEKYNHYQEIDSEECAVIIKTDFDDSAELGPGTYQALLKRTILGSALHEKFPQTADAITQILLEGFRTYLRRPYVGTPYKRNEADIVAVKLAQGVMPELPEVSEETPLVFSGPPAKKTITTDFHRFQIPFLG